MDEETLNTQLNISRSYEKSGLITGDKMNPKPIDTKTAYDVVEVVFEDGMIMRFQPYTYGIGYQIEGLHSVEIINDNHRIFVYNARLYRCGPQPSEHKIVKMEGVTQKQVAEYWESAMQYIKTLFYPKGMSEKHNDEYWYHWHVINEGRIDLDRLKEEKAEFIKK